MYKRQFTLSLKFNELSDLLNVTLPLAPVNVTLSVNVETPDTFNRLKNEDPVVLIPAIPLVPPDAVTVTIPAEIAETSKFVEKLIVPAVPTLLPSCCMTIPVPDAVTPVSPDPSPLNDVAVQTPVIIAPLFVTSNFSFPS